MAKEKLLFKTRQLTRLGASLLGAVALLSSSVVFAQVKIGSNPTTVNSNAVLDIESANKGVLFPRVSLTSTDNASPLTGHIAGMQVYNTASGTDVDPGIYYNDGTKWVRAGAETEKVFVFGSGAPTGGCTTGTMYVDTLEESATEGNTWSCVGGSWVDYQPKPSNAATTPFYLRNSRVDAKGDKASQIYRTGNVGFGYATVPRAPVHAEGNILASRNNNTHAGLHNGTNLYNGVVNYYNRNSRTAYIAVQNSTNAPNIYLSKRLASAGDVYIRFNLTSNGNTGEAGSISRGGGYTVAYNTSSDQRLKENIKSTRYGIADLMKIEVRDYNYIADKKTIVTGFLAQQLYTVFPNAVTVGGKDATENPWSVDYGKVTPLLVKAIQDQQAEIEKLKQQNKVLTEQVDKVASMSARIEEMQTQMSQLITTSKSSEVVVSK
ncbi:hypothetical protein DSL64_26770 [Dyadobacter luteus]|uniref:Peptidase S74 domain-containing protein n=1 Tax=Dyadobacter luteus TaxID=2259619 RepID=A0A3D8Y3N2_9BACT|nr:tail fiber domain-containing protein [Dyadobacter luteus]REA56523.1 hypothetical protein DSL64_26770 [Dyadobacter luteus]